MKDHPCLERARDRVFMSGVGDVAEQLCRANMTIGVAKIQHAEQRLGLESRALFVGAPDATVTRNIFRWRQGFGYGGQVRWNPEMVVLDSKPNGCGMLVGAPRRPMVQAAVEEADQAVRRDRLTMEGVELAYDLGESNHFVDGLELEQVLVESAETPLPDELFVIHSSGHEHRPDSPLGPGLYVDESEQLARMATVIQTPWGSLSVLTGDAAREYNRFCSDVQAFNCRRRSLFGRLLFGEHEDICNLTHQGIRGPGVFHLGTYWFDDDARLYPLTLGPDQPVYLLRPKKNFSRAAIRTLGWEGRADLLGVTGLMQQINMLPHGGGYTFPQLEQLIRVEVQDGGRREFWLEPRDGPALKMEDARDLPFVYRDLAVLHRLIELDMAVPVARYRVRFVVQR